MQIRHIDGKISFKKARANLVIPILLFTLLFVGCATMPGIRSNTSFAPDVPYTAPKNIMKPRSSETATTSSVLDQFKNLNNLSLGDIINIALQNSTQTRYAWLQARAAAGVLG